MDSDNRMLGSRIRVLEIDLSAKFGSALHEPR
jgi:hypothetical protein